MNIRKKIAAFSINQYKWVTTVIVLLTSVIILMAALPSIFPEKFPYLNSLRVDTDPENMLPANEHVRILHNNMKKVLQLYDMVVVGIVNEDHPDGVFNTKTLNNIYELTKFAKTLHWTENGEEKGVVEVDLIAPSTVDNIEQGGLGVVKFEWLMSTPPKTREEAIAVREKALKIPFLNGTLVSEDGKALAIYIPLTHKDLSYRVYSALKQKVAEFDGDEYHITGLPVAEDTFGVEMFIQMAVSAPAAMVVIFILMLIFFRKLILIISPMIVAMVSVIITMGTLVISGFPVHIMSSMIPIFIMPIAVLDSIHIISEFFELYQQTRSRKLTMIKVMDELFTPMLYTSLTSAAGFASLALTPIPPVQVFGLFIALGIMLAWILTIIFIPAYVMFLKPETLEKFGAVHIPGKEETLTITGKFMARVSKVTYRYAKVILTVAVLLVIFSIYGMSLININDNPVKWFTPSHPIRVADRVLNKHFGGTYMAYLALSARDEHFDRRSFARTFRTNAERRITSLDFREAASVFNEVINLIAKSAMTASSSKEVYQNAMDFINKKLDTTSDAFAEAWDEVSLFVEEEKQKNQIFKNPKVLDYISNLQNALLDTHVVGKSNSLADIVKTVHRELFEGKPDHYSIPATSKAVAQCMISYQSSHRPNDLWHFVTPDYRKSSIWVQLKSGDNKDMSAVVDSIEKYIASNPPPIPLKIEWFGLTYINVVWQQKMVSGMLEAFAGSFLVVFLMMTVLFRSALWGILSMLPLTITIGSIYGTVGIIGKDYDMPVAVLSSMTLGLAVDFAIHFLARSRQMYLSLHSWENTVPVIFSEPARAIGRNIIVIAVGFLPLLLAPLTPYKTVGALLAAILLVSGAGTLLLLPALMKVLEKPLFRSKPVAGQCCNCVACVVSSVTLVVLIALTLDSFAQVSWSTLTWFVVITVPVMALGCGLLSRREKCKILTNEEVI
ncbi:MAG: MMPL family transporter [Candidatus Magnetomorum sp.]|nr:MMPL family transporter [Candidatus Magnetomorum sp.]